MYTARASHAHNASCNKIYWLIVTKKTQFSRDLLFVYITTESAASGEAAAAAAGLHPFVEWSVGRTSALNSARYRQKGRRRFILSETNLETINFILSLDFGDVAAPYR